MASKGTRKLVPESKQGLYRFRTEVAKEWESLNIMDI